MSEQVRRTARRFARTRVLAVSSGKGGVGKTIVALALATVLASAKKKVLLMDADIGTANVNVVLGRPVEYNLWDVIKGRIPVEQTICTIGENLDLLPGVNGVYEATFWRQHHTEKLWKDLDHRLSLYDYVIVDTGAGISNTIVQFISASDELVVVFTPEATSVTDAYALIKTLHAENYTGRTYLVENMVRRQEADYIIAVSLKTMIQRFLNREIEILGTLPYDPDIPRHVRYQDMDKYLQRADDFMFHVGNVVRKLTRNTEELGTYRPSFWSKLRARLGNIVST